MQCELAETKQRMEVVLVTDIFMESPNSQNWPWTSRTFYHPQHRCQPWHVTVHKDHLKSKSFTAPLFMSHQTSISQLLDICYQKNTLHDISFLSTLKWGIELPCFCMFDSDPCYQFNIVSSYFTVKDTKMESWYKCIRCSFGEVKSEKVSTPALLPPLIDQYSIHDARNALKPSNTSIFFC